jgi:hypothetical protein
MDAPDPNIQDRLKNQPPFDNEEPVKEEKPTEVEEVVEPSVPQEPVEEEKPVEEAPKEEEVNDRTKQQFEKLTEHNKNLKKENEELKRKNVLDSLIPEPEAPQFPQEPVTNRIPLKEQYPGLTQKQIEETFTGLVDENGYVDTGLLIGTLKDLQNRNIQAERRALDAEKKTETKDTTVKLQDMAQPKSVEATYQKLLSESTIEQKKDPMFLQSLKEEAAMLSSVPTAVAQAATPSILGTRATSATLENKNLKEEEIKQSSPVVVNRTTNVVNNGGNSGGSGSVLVRNDEPVLTRLQFQNMRPV